MRKLKRLLVGMDLLFPLGKYVSQFSLLRPLQSWNAPAQAVKCDNAVLVGLSQFTGERAVKSVKSVSLLSADESHAERILAQKIISLNKIPCLNIQGDLYGLGKTFVDI